MDRAAVWAGRAAGCSAVGMSPRRGLPFMQRKKQMESHYLAAQNQTAPTHGRCPFCKGGGGEGCCVPWASPPASVGRPPSSLQFYFPLAFRAPPHFAQRSSNRPRRRTVGGGGEGVKG